MVRLSAERLAHAAFLYYVQGLSQMEVAKQLGVTRSNVSRMLTAAREQYIVKFEIAYPLDRDPAMEQRLLARFSKDGVSEVVVVPGRDTGVGATSHGLLAVGQAGVGWLDKNLKDGQILGLCWGSTVEAMVDSAHFNRRVDVEVIQLAGELSIDSRFSGHDLVRNLAEKLGGRYRYFNAPATTQDEATAAALMKTEQVANALALGRTSDVAVLGIGQYGMDSSNLFLQRACASDDEIREAVDRGAVGQISGRFYDSSGKQLDLAINRRIISLDLEDLRDIDTVVAVASGPFKAEAVSAAIRGGLVNVLIVDSALGQALEAA
jgi:deoxyribonucleoside regulator